MEKQKATMMKDMTEGNVAVLLLQFALPLFVSNALQAAYNLVDMVIVGQYIGGAGMSAVSIGGDILHFLTFVAMGFSSAGQVLIAKNVGSKRMDEVQKLIGTMFSFLLCVSLVVSVVCFFLRHQILSAINTPEESYAYTLSYMVTCIVGLFFIYGYNIVSAILRGMGDSKRPFTFIAIAAILNTVFDYIFIVHMGLAVFGAALATVIGQGISFIASIIYLYRHREAFGFDFRPQSFRIEKTALKPLVALGIPMAIQSASITFSKIVLLSWVNLGGVGYSALNGILNKVNTMASVVSHSFTAAGSTMVGQNLGARKYDRISRIILCVLVFGLVFFTLCVVLILVSPEAIYRVFTSDTEVLALSAIATFPMVLNLYGACTRTVSFSLINGSGNTKLNFAIAIFDGLVGRIGLAALLCFTFEMGSRGCWLGDAIAGFVPFLIGLVFYISRRWKE